MSLFSEGMIASLWNSVDVQDAIFLEEGSSASSPTFSSFIHHKQQPFKTAENEMKYFPQVSKLPNVLIGRYLVDFFVSLPTDYRSLLAHPQYDK